MEKAFVTQCECENRTAKLNTSGQSFIADIF